MSWRSITLRPLTAPFAQFPFSGAIVDIDFVRQLYFWAGVLKKTSDFATFTIGNGSIDSRGLLVGSTTSITLATATMGLSSPASIVSCLLPTGTASVSSAIPIIINDGTNNNRFSVIGTTANQHQISIITAGVTEASSAQTYLVGQKSGIAAGWATNSFRYAQSRTAVKGLVFNGIYDTAVNIPTVTTMTIGLSGTLYPGYVQRLIFFDRQLDYPELGRYALGVTMPINPS